MTAGLPELLDDAARSVPVGGAPDLAARAWADGRRRHLRSRRRASLVAVAALVLLALALPLPGAPGPPPQPARPEGAVDGHPARIGRQWLVRELPDRPGPVAALLQTVDERPSWDEPEGWSAVTADGHRWRLPGSASSQLHPALSPDGRRVGWLRTDEGPFVVRDLVTGRETVFEQVGGDRLPARRPYGIALQVPARFSPDGGQVVVLGPAGPLLLDVGTGAVTVLPQRGSLAGWAGDRLVWLADGRYADPAVPGVRVVVTDRRGDVVRTTLLRPRGAPLEAVSQWTGTTSGDGALVAVTPDGGPVRRFATADGREVGHPVAAPVRQPCATSTGRTGALVVPTLVDRSLVAELVLADRTRPVTAVSAGVGARCLVLAADAVDGPAVGGGPSSVLWTLSWWWRELLVTGAAALLLAGLLRRRWARRRGRTA